MKDFSGSAGRSVGSTYYVLEGRRRLLPLGRLLSGERRPAGVPDVRFEPEFAGHVQAGVGQQGREPAFRPELLERHAQPGFQADGVRIVIVVVVVVHDGLRQFAFDVLVLHVLQFLDGQTVRVQGRTVLAGRGHGVVPTAQGAQYRLDRL